MSLVLYGITEAAAPQTDGVGLSEQPLRSVTEGNLRAVVSNVGEPLRPTETSLWTYERVVERMMADTTVLPARFGTTALAEDEIAAMLAERRTELSESLARVRDAVEYAVRAPAPTQGPRPVQGSADPPTTGTAYMERLLTQDRRIRELDAAADALVRAKQRTTYGTAYLVDRADADAFVIRVSELALTVTGPWPPYSFTSPS